jgi:tRNA threonylcarbamoyladenosine biosynthesis protein TsaB
VNVLAFESSSHLLSTAIWRDGIILERSQRVPNAGSEHLLPCVMELCNEAGITLRDVDAIAFGSGPGGFVGIRLACGIAQGLAFGLDLPILGVCTLEALAIAVGAELVYACIDARMGEVYAASYEIDEKAGIARVVRRPGVYPPGKVPVPEYGEWKGGGDGFAEHGDILRLRLGRTLSGIDISALPTAGAVARLAAPRFANGEGRDFSAALPEYVRDRVARTTAERLAQGGFK